MLEEKTDNKNPLIGVLLMGIILIGYYLFIDIPEEKTLVEDAQTTEQQVTSTPVTEVATNAALNTNASDSVLYAAARDNYGVFAQASLRTDAKAVVLENDKVKIVLSEKGGRINEVFLKEYKTYDSLAVRLMTPEASSLNLGFWSQNRKVNTQDFVFDSKLIEQDGAQLLSMKLIAGPQKYLEFQYKLEKDAYKVDFSINTVGLTGIVQANSEIAFDWKVSMPRQEKNLDNERNTSTIYYTEEGDVDYISEMSDDTETVNDLKWFAFKDQFFSTILYSDKEMDGVVLTTETDENSQDYVKSAEAKFKLKYSNGDQSYPMEMYFVPNHFKTLRSYDKDFEQVIPLGWAIIGWLNRFFVIELFSFLDGFDLGYGLIIFIMALLLKLMLYPIAKKSYVSMATMRVLKPEIDAINEKYEDQAKRSQAVMELYRKAGANPLGGCIPMLLQMPILFAFFRFFPASIELRQQGFLWADDLSTFDSIYNFPGGFEIPFYGDHVSLFTILMTISSFIQIIYNNQMSSANTQMPQMKYMMYLMPVIFLGVMNNYAAALSYYYFIANMMTFGQQYFIRKRINDEAILAKIEQNKTKPKKKSTFQQRMEEMAKKQAEVSKKNK